MIPCSLPVLMDSLDTKWRLVPQESGVVTIQPPHLESVFQPLDSTTLNFKSTAIFIKNQRRQTQFLFFTPHISARKRHLKKIELHMFSNLCSSLKGQETNVFFLHNIVKMSLQQVSPMIQYIALQDFSILSHAVKNFAREIYASPLRTAYSTVHIGIYSGIAQAHYEVCQR